MPQRDGTTRRKIINIQKSKKIEWAKDFTQMVWKDTKEVGISYAISKSGSVYVVARYYPPGNYSGEYPY